MNTRNASILGVIASASSAAGLLAVFRMSIELLGGEALGSWVLIQSLFFLSKVAEGGVGVNLTRIFALDKKRLGAVSPWAYYIAGLGLTLLPVVFIGLSLVAPAKLLLIGHFKVDLTAAVISHLLLLSLVQCAASAISSIGLALLEGAGMLSARHAVSIASNAIFVVGAYPAIGSLGIYGLPTLYIVASGVGALISVSLLVRIDSQFAPRALDVMARIKAESLSASGMAVLRTGFEPWTKFVAGSFGSLAAVAALDLAFRVSTQVRLVIQAATQPLLYIGARSSEEMSEATLKSYATANTLVVQANWGGLMLLASCAPFVSYLGFGHVSGDATIFLVVLAIGNCINSMGVIGYYAEASRGALNSLLRIHAEMAVINVIVGGVAGWLAGPMGAAAGYALSFSYGGAALIRIWARTVSKTGLALVRPGWTIGWVACISLFIAVSMVVAPLRELQVLAVSFVSSLVLGSIFVAVSLKRWRRING